MLYQHDHCALLESVLDPGHVVTVDHHGKIADESSAGYADLSKEFVVFVKVKWWKGIKVCIVKYPLSFAFLRQIRELSH